MTRLLSHTLLVLILTALPASAQFQATDSTDAEQPSNHDARVMLLAKRTDEGVVLRWAPDKPGAFHILNSYGYIIERVRVNADGSISDDGVSTLTPEPLRPWSLDEWKRRIMQDTSQIALAVAAQLMHGTFFTPPKNPDDQLEVLRNGVRDAENRFGFALMLADTDPRIAEGMALRFVDRDVRSGERVVYRIMPAQQAKDYSIDTAVIVVEVGEIESNPAPQNLRFISHDGSITLQWDQHPLSPYSAWLVERSDDDGRSWSIRTKNPHIIVAPAGEERSITPSYQDNIAVTNYIRYRYRVRGINAFGERSEAAEVTAWSADQQGPGAPVIRKAKQIARNGVLLEWEAASDAQDLHGYVVARAANPKSGTPFTPLHEGILSPDTRFFFDNEANDRAAWYSVTAVDTAGNKSESIRTYVQIIDSLPPAAPTGITARVDSAGLVTIRWTRNTEEDIDGYRVLWANDLSHEFSQLTPHIHRDTMITHQITLQTSTPHVYYKVQAVDTRYMHSEPSAVVEVQRPDILPPDAPVFTDVRVSDAQVELQWARSGSEDVRAQRLERRSTGSDWQLIATPDTATGSYVDVDIERGTEYEYRITAIDVSGLEAHCPRTVRGRPYDTGVRDAVQSLHAAYDEARGKVIVSWSYPAAPREDYWFVIYRGVGNETPQQYTTASHDSSEWSEPVRPGETYHYAVRVKSGSGESRMSPVASVTIQ
ncbi:MAG: hypothetical protein M5R41_07700 [Bacteroidia bacterium]|nr:hypothetical protein [Bacteroidia bacterium]